MTLDGDANYVLDQQGNPVAEPDFAAWSRWNYAHNAERRIAVDYRDGVRVSTVFLAINHRFAPGPPILWETMIFGGDHAGYQERYTSAAAARDGHDRAMVLAYEGANPDEQ